MNDVKGLLFAAFLLFDVSCVNNDFDLNKKVNLELTFGGEMIAFPIGNMDTVFMIDLIDTTETIKLENGKYVMVKSDKVAPSLITINNVSLRPEKTTIEEVGLNFRDYDPKNYVSGIQKLNSWDKYMISDVKSDKCKFIIEDDVPEEFSELKSVKFDPGTEPECIIRINLDLNSMDGIESVQLKDFRCYLPQFLEFYSEDETVEVGEGGVITINEITRQFEGVMYKTLKIKSVDFRDNEGRGLEVVSDGEILKILKDADIRIEGQVVLKLSMASTQSATALYEGTMNAEFEVEKMKLVKIQGMFDPKVENINELVKLNLGDDVDFLKEDANLDFSNPQIYLSLGNNVGIPLKVDMTLWGEDSDGNMIQGSEVAIKDLLIDETEICGESKTTKWAISRTGNVKSGYNVMMVDEISKLMRKIPENVRFSMNVNSYGDNHNVDLSKTMEFTGEYEVNVPLDFDDLNLIYIETIDGLQSDLKDFSDLQDSYTIHIVGTVENAMPINMEIKAVAYDIEGNEIPETLVSVDVEDNIIKSSGIGTSSSPLKIVLKTKEKGLSKLDKIDIKITAISDPQNGPISFEAKQYLIIKDMKMRIIGGITIDAN